MIKTNFTDQTIKELDQYFYWLNNKVETDVVHLFVEWINSDNNDLEDENIQLLQLLIIIEFSK